MPQPARSVEPVCIWCSEEWPMSPHEDERGQHVLEADGVYGPADCQRPEEKAKRLAVTTREKLIEALWRQALKSHPRDYQSRLSHFQELLAVNNIK